MAARKAAREPSRVCFWCDEPGTRRRPLFVHVHHPDAPLHGKCARIKFRLNEAEAASVLVPVET